MMQWYIRESIARDVHLGLRTNRSTLADDKFSGLLEQTVSQIKRSNVESAESQMKETKRLKFNESLKKNKVTRGPLQLRCSSFLC